MSAGLSSISPSVSLEELRDQQAFPVILFTKLGRNGTRTYRLADKSRRPIDISLMTI